MTKILVVDDDLYNSKITVHVLQKQGFEVVQTDSGYAGVTLAQLEEPDLILMNSAMPQLNGIQATEQLKASVYTRHIPVIMMVAELESDDIAHYKAFGCDAVLEKQPTIYSALLGTINQLLGVFV